MSCGQDSVPGPGCWRVARSCATPGADLITAHRKAQDAAKAVLRELAEDIRPDDTECSIATRARARLQAQGIPETWYHDCPALVLLGARSCTSVSGRDYRPAAAAVGETNLVTVDLSPSHLGRWGDCARSFAVEEGRVTSTPQSPAFVAGLSFLQGLHAKMRQFVTPQTTFHELAIWSARQMEANGFLNLDFLGNVGHSIAARREDRIYIEPHVRQIGGAWGFKHEDIFFFDAVGMLQEL